MKELTYEQARVLCRVPGMPMEYSETQVSDFDYGIWQKKTTGTYEHLSKDPVVYRLTPGAPLTPEQAAICLAMGVEIEERIKNYEWRRQSRCLLVFRDSIYTYRVPPEVKP